MKKRNAITILYEDEHLLAVNKPAGLPSVPDPTHPVERTLLGQIRQKYPEKTYLLHRLDRETSGVLLFGKEPKEREILEAILPDPATEKIYLALLKGVPQGNKVSYPLKARTKTDLIPALTEFSIVKKVIIFEQICSLVEAKIKTGRRHQIRQHFAMIHCPVVMDREYGNAKFNHRFGRVFQFGRLVLHAHSIKFIHPFKQEVIQIKAPLTADLGSLFKKIWGRKWEPL